MSTEPEKVETAEETAIEAAGESSTLRVIGWFSVGMVVAALGIYLGKFKRRTPYDFYSNSEQQASEFGMGI
jgi:hypothetical protein